MQSVLFPSSQKRHQRGGLTTSEAPWVVDARQTGRLRIDQPWNLYSGENHTTWRGLYQQMQPYWERFADERFLQGLAALRIQGQQVPRLENLCASLSSLSGFRIQPVAGRVPAFDFFDGLANRELPATVTIRGRVDFGDPSEPDIFSDIAGAVPMLTDRAFAEALVRFGNCGRTVARIAAGISDPAERQRRLESMLQALNRVFWFTIQFGLIRTGVGLRAFGSTLLTLGSELENALTSPSVQRYPVRLEWIINQGYEKTQQQPLLFFVSGFDHLSELITQMETWLAEGRLFNVAPNGASIPEGDLASFVNAPLS